MNISFSYFWEQMLANPVLLIAVLLTLGVIFVNGWTDAPNAIATCVATRSMPAGAAILMSAVCNFLGVLVMSLVNTTVAMTIKNMVNFNGDNKKALIALCAAMFAIVVWAVAAWYFGIPTSESHALIAGLSGAAISLQGGLSGINPAEWMKVIYGLGLSSILGFASGYGASKMTIFLCKNMERRKTNKFFTGAQ
ncbi:MAG: inorganic phosphate transporter, partial [Lachnospiraceae bacterium]|nr:inorganic phosphate transporter [Lachnospiraceae bacterium]